MDTRAAPVAAAKIPDPSAVWRLGLVTFGTGALASALGMLAIQQYPLKRESLETMHAARRAGHVAGWCSLVFPVTAASASRAWRAR